jgi:hypothetical protein
LAIDRTVVPGGPTLQVNKDHAGPDGRRPATMKPAIAVVRSLVMVALAAFAILVLLPVAVAGQASAGI